MSTAHIPDYEKKLRARADELHAQCAKAINRGASDAEVAEIRRGVAELQEFKQAYQDNQSIQREIEKMWAGSATASASFGGAFLKAGFDRSRQPCAAVPAVPALGVKAPTMPGAGDLNRHSLVDVAPLGRDARFLYPNLAVRDASNETAIDDFRETARSVTGTVERAIDATTDKAELATTIEHVVASFAQWAVVLSGVPNAVLESRDAFTALFEGSMRYEVQKAIDAHAVAQILAASPPAGDWGRRGR